MGAKWSCWPMAKERGDHLASQMEGLAAGWSNFRRVHMGRRRNLGHEMDDGGILW